ncbi:MAG: hypothetical protein ACD_3C00106G0019 [uncultured bacterium (gcode 4)]|uniref:DUF218 domain-containing protein n=1 Tax=uncultured bacterium (gcode 4) TaxID=1234023 RepID=K2GXF0_9BACT|nr:MAG: hypothetical protein ACD_3C00106G0019 [uncultured bacterium (gcode 4)]
MKNIDAIIVLWWWINIDWSLWEITKSRTEKAVDLYNSSISKKVIMSGKWSMWLTDIPKQTEARAMRDYAISLWVNSQDIMLEEDSVDTLGNAYFVKQILSEGNWKYNTVVTSDFHKSRTEYSFNKILWPEYMTNFEFVESNLSSEQFESIKQKESKVLSFTKKYLDPICDWDDVEITEKLFSFHPWYATNPLVTKEDFINMLKS